MPVHDDVEFRHLAPHVARRRGRPGSLRSHRFLTFLFAAVRQRRKRRLQARGSCRPRASSRLRAPSRTSSSVFNRATSRSRAPRESRWATTSRSRCRKAAVASAARLVASAARLVASAARQSRAGLPVAPRFRAGRCLLGRRGSLLAWAARVVACLGGAGRWLLGGAGRCLLGGRGPLVAWGARGRWLLGGAGRWLLGGAGRGGFEAAPLAHGGFTNRERR